MCRNLSTEALPPKLTRHRVSGEDIGVVERKFVFEVLLAGLICHSILIGDRAKRKVAFHAADSAEAKSRAY